MFCFFKLGFELFKLGFELFDLIQKVMCVENHCAAFNQMG